MDIENYMKDKGFYFYVEDTEIFVAKSKDELYQTYLSEQDDKEDYPVAVVSVDLEDKLHTEEPLSEEDIKVEDYWYESKIKHLIKIAAENEWETPWQVSSSYY